MSRHHQGRRRNPKSSVSLTTRKDHLHGRGKCSASCWTKVAGDNVGILLRGTKREDVERGQSAVQARLHQAPPTSLAKCTFEWDEGGRHTPFFNNYRPQFYFRTTDVTGSIELPADKEMVMPGDNVSITVKLIAPIAMEEGLRFAIREGGRTVGAGVVCQDHRVICFWSRV